jgi:basic amino acid/polyamine antiporter, APA family
MQQTGQLQRRLRLFDATTLVAGSMIGSAIFFGLSIMAGLFRLRWTRPDLPRPYRCWGYPIAPALYLAICSWFLIFVIQGDPYATGIGLVLVLTGIPFYSVWKSRR